MSNAPYDKLVFISRPPKLRLDQLTAGLDKLGFVEQNREDFDRIRRHVDHRRGLAVDRPVNPGSPLIDLRPPLPRRTASSGHRERRRRAT